LKGMHIGNCLRIEQTSGAALADDYVTTAT